ncbi:MAG TPA: ATP-binding protein [Phenylobacterium sp.]|uniref:hybrid sensor histidine kinase/response regulator n=1 Tax=Phenylobacterium sp. TaxID=1871053 RepID=UPI002B476C5B|nr:ATP-binding protein [Phenylobacterium sp.]HKR88196.1 ATP-binding protein [Phenylobacterium sp.]
MTSPAATRTVPLDPHALFAALPGNYVLLAADPDFTMVAITDERLAATMTRRDDTIGRPLFEVFPDNPDDPNADGVLNLRASLEQVLRTRSPDRMPIQRYDIRRADGTFEEHYWSPINWPLIGPDGSVTHIIHAAEDVTDSVREANQRLEIEARLRDREAELRQLNSSLEQRVAERTRERDRIWQLTTDLMSVSNVQGWLLAVNGAWTATLGWTEAELCSTPVLDFIHPDDVEATWAEILRLADGGATLRFENRVRHREGGFRHISWRASPENGLIYAIGRDITERLRNEEVLRQAHKMEAVGQLTGGVAHDFNNLLTIIRSSVDLLGRPGLSEARRARYIQAISETVDRATKVTGQLLAFARRHPLDPEVFDVKERISDVAELVRGLVGPGVHIETRVPQSPCAVEADIAQFETALVNLAVNARDAMQGAGGLTIEVTRVSQLPPVRRHAGISGDFVAVAVRDTGSGIAPEHLQSIFEPFFTTKDVGKGTGLGLSQVYGFAKQSGGEIDVESRLGGGSTFTLYLPRSSKAPAPQPEPDTPRKSAAHARGARVLVVEDNLEVGAFSTAMLHDLGFRTTWVTSAEEALELLKEERRSFDVVFSDVVMPGISGVELGRSIRSHHPDLPVVLTSGYSHVLAEEGRHGFALLAKPYSAESLARTLRGAMAPEAGRMDPVPASAARAETGPAA